MTESFLIGDRINNMAKFRITPRGSEGVINKFEIEKIKGTES